MKIRFARRAATALTAFVLILVAAGLALTQTGAGRAVLAGLISRAASTPGQGVRVEGLDGLLSGKLRIGTLAVSDGNGDWLEVRDVAVEWTPRALLSRHLDIFRLTVGAITLHRFPQPGETGSDDTAAGGLPVSVSLGDLDIRRIHIAAAAAGSDFDLRAQGSAAIAREPVRMKLDLAVKRDDDIAGGARARVDFAPAGNTLDLDVAAREPAGGVIAGLLRLPGQPAVDFSLKGRGALDDWSGTLALDLDGSRTLDGAARITRSDGGLAGTLALNGRIATLVPTPLAALFAGETRLDLQAARNAAGTIRIGRLHLVSHAATLAASGTIEPAGGTLELDAEAKVAAEAGWLAYGDGAAEVKLRAPRAEIHVGGTRGDASWRLTAQLEGLETPHGTAGAVALTASGEHADLQRRTAPFSAQLDVADLRPTEAHAARLATGPAKLTAAGALAGDRIRFDKAELAAAELGVTLAGWVDTATSAFEAEIEADSAWPVALDGFPGLAGDRLAVAGGLAGDADGGFRARGLSIASKALTATIDGSFTGNAIEAEIAGRLPDLALFHAATAGAVEFTLEASGDTTAPGVALEAHGSGVTLQGTALEAPRLVVKGVASAEAPAGTLALSARLAGQDLSGSARVSSEAGITRIDDLAFTAPGARLAGALVVGASGVPTGSLRLDAADLSGIAPLLLADIAGSLTAEATLREEAGRLAVTAKATAPSVRYEATAVGDATISAAITDALGAFAAEGMVKATSVTTGGTEIRDIAVSASRAQDGANATRFDAKAVAAGIPVEAAGLLTTAPARTVIRLEKAAAHYRDIRATLKKPVEIAVAGSTVTLGDTLIGVGGGTVRLSGRAGEKLALDAEIASLPMTLVDAFAPGTGARGTLNGKVAVSGTAKDPAVDYSATWSGAGLAALNAAGIPALTVSADGRYHAGVAAFTAKAGGIRGLSIDASGKAATAGQGRLDARVNGTLPLTLLDRTLAAGGRRLTGTARLDLSVIGPFARPALSGTVSTADAVFVDSGAGIVVRSIALKADIAPERVTVRSLTGEFSTGGKLSGEGTVGIAPGSGYPAALKARISNGKYSDGKLVAASFDADLSLDGPLAGAATLGGRVVLGRVDITIPEKLPVSVASLDVRHRHAPASVARQAEAIAPAPQDAGRTRGGDKGGLLLDVAVSAPRGIFVRGRGIDAELGGDLTLKGPASAPVAVGRFAMHRGRLDLLTRRFVFSRGTVGFSGSLEPWLDFAAETAVASDTITVSVTGRASDPRIDLSSSSGLPDEEILPRLLFGSDLSDLTPFQAAQLASAVATLGGIGGSSSVVDKIRNTFGLSDLDITTDESGGAKVSVGRQVGDRVYIGVEQGTSRSSSRVKVDIDITKNLKARGEVGADGKSKAGIFFERNY